MQLKFNDISLDIGEVSYEDSKFSMHNETPYIEKVVKKYNTSGNYRKNLLPLKLRCLYNIKEYLGDSYVGYLDLLGGIGISAKIFNREEFIVNELDKSCVEILEKNFPLENVSAHDMYSFPFEPTDFIFADFNNLTIKRMVGEYKPVLDKVFANSKKYVLLNDCSVFYLKYGPSSYKTYATLMNTPIASSKAEFYATVRDWMHAQWPEWYLTRVESFKDTSFLLFEKEDKPLSFKVNINDGTLPDITIQ